MAHPRRFRFGVQASNVTDLDKAPRNAKGMVEFSSPFFILKPIDMKRGNQKIFYGVNNRGNKIEYAWRTAQPQTSGRASRRRSP